MTTLLMIIGFGAAPSVVVGLGQKLKLPWPALMVLIGIAGAFIPTFAEVAIDPELVLPLFLPPLLFATGSRTAPTMSSVPQRRARAAGTAGGRARGRWPPRRRWG